MCLRHHLLVEVAEQLVRMRQRAVQIVADPVERNPLSLCAMSAICTWSSSSVLGTVGSSTGVWRTSTLARGAFGNMSSAT